MKKLSLLLMLLFAGYTFAQEYTFQKAGAEDYSFDMKGKVIIKDTLITIESENHKAFTYPVKKEFENDTLKKYISSLKELNASFFLNNKGKTFVYEFNDPNTNKSTKMTYLLD